LVRQSSAPGAGASDRELSARSPIQPDGKIVAVGSPEKNPTAVTDVFVARYLGS